MDITVKDAAGASQTVRGDSVAVSSSKAVDAWTVRTPISINTSAFDIGLVTNNDAFLVTALGGKSARVGMYINAFFGSNMAAWPTPGGTDDATTKAQLDLAFAQGIRPVLLITSHSAGPNQDFNDNVPMTALLKCLLTLYKGRIDIELTNEPDVGAGPHYDAPRLAAFYNFHYPKIKAIDPLCQIIGPAFDGCSGVGTGTPSEPVFGQPGLSYVNAFMAAARNSVDIVAIHIYYQMRPEHRFMSTRIVRAAFADKDVAITETGWNMGRPQAQAPNEAQSACSGDQQKHADWTTRDYLLQSCIPRMRYLQSYRSRASGVVPQDGFWIFNQSGGDTPTSLAIKDIGALLRMSASRRLYQIGSGDMLKDVLAVALTMRDSSHKLLAWCNAGAATLPVWCVGTTTAVKTIGTATTQSVQINGQKQVSLAVGTRPVLVSGCDMPEYA